ncbi:MFS transporter [Bradyrhizobium sp. U87765 SZCCT0131]|uniref:MFS transporter n=1 Tax=unclassified Bradyrhizobium TaxID=2631580 RepID=UPI001BABFBE4|nr:MULTISPECIES: MFS transporter [unclassified Bradyrhizobium]MBR1223214.1 MFS transporter [Bradyrhizobium sp. U87765 SZCCT0131]MBR1265835.1 MFS transporter [Bradyrhizobium sp. U87765 SZCCT0134]MBR1309372.1 MFS transporter [Bradyrhizobium sp. U87765 SZCCT0110]MBR1324050.1 MFS transporter [Bradyrhizobium sp. U87765 SZCCT0109]MBR1348259.1 MFS transporter [Bradyrhizobium sp. U87765 SZCCT0048]
MPSAMLRTLRPALPILIGASLMLSLSMGLRQSLGIFMQSLTHDIGISVSDFTLAIAVQNLAWGFLQPPAGALTVRYGFRPIMIAGALFYIAGLALMAASHGLVTIMLGAGVLIGVSLACTASAIAMSVATRATPPAVRSTVLGLVSGAGSLGALMAAPLGQILNQTQGWRIGLIGFVVLSLALIPAAWFAGRIDRVPLPRAAGAEIGDVSAGAALRGALGNASFLVMMSAYFVCGMQLVFITTHLPSYLQFCGMDPMLSAQALGVIGGFNVLGSLFFGWAGGRWNKLMLLGLIYVGRSLVLAWYFMSPPTAGSTLAFAAMMGFLWLGVSPLVAGSVAEMFGLRWQAMIQGVAFMNHQIGSFLGAYGGGVIYDMLGSYTLAWQLGLALGLTAGVVQVAFALVRPSEPPLVAAGRS